MSLNRKPSSSPEKQLRPSGLALRKSSEFTLLIVDSNRERRDHLEKILHLDGFDLRVMNHITAHQDSALAMLPSTKSIDVVIGHLPDVVIKSLLTCLGSKIPKIIGYGISAEHFDPGIVQVFPLPISLFNILNAVRISTYQIGRKKVSESPDQRRVFDRYDVKFKIDVELERPGDLRQGEVVNLGHGGMFLNIKYPIPPVGETLRFKIRFSEKKEWALEGTAVVRWVRLEEKDGLPVGCGVEFSNLTEMSIENLSLVLNVLRTTEFIPES